MDRDSATSPAPSYFAEGSARPLFTWVHLSDIHFGHGSRGHQVNQERVLGMLLTDLDHTPPPFQAVDAVFITGDIAFSGGLRNDNGKREYDEALQFVEKLCKVLGLKKQQVFVVPGNHDVQREADNDDKVSDRLRLVHLLREGAMLDDWLARPGERALLKERFSNYLQFARELGGGCHELWWARSLTGRRGLKLRIVGLNSALLCLDEHDRGKLQIGLSQFMELYPDMNTREFAIFLTHHPLEWLSPWDKARGLLRSYAHLHLCGHMHDAQTWRTHSGGGSDMVQVLAGAAHVEQQYMGGRSNPRIQDALPPRGQGYNLGFLALGKEDQLQVWLRPRAWSDNRHRFQVDADGTPEGSPVVAHATSFSPRLEPEVLPHPHLTRPEPRSEPRVFDVAEVDSICRSLDDITLARLHSVEEFLDFMARSFENLFQLERHALDIHPLFKKVRDRLKAMTPGISLNETDGELTRAKVRHVILRQDSLLTLIRKVSTPDLQECGKQIGKGAAEDLIRHIEDVAKAVPASPEAFIALWDFWDRTGGWGKFSLEPVLDAKEGKHPRTWRLRIAKSFLCVKADAAETHRLSAFWCGYIHGFLNKALPSIGDQMAKVLDKSVCEKVAFPAYTEVTEVRHLEKGTDGNDLFEIQFQAQRYSGALEELSRSNAQLADEEYEDSMLSCRRALESAREIRGNEQFEAFLETVTSEERDTVRVIEASRSYWDQLVNATIARRWFCITNNLIHKLAEPECSKGNGDSDDTTRH